MKLQNNFTTPEQSKRLLELGLPADSADMYYITVKKEGSEREYLCNNGTPTVININYGISVGSFRTQANLIPCWSVGRLMEIAFATRNTENKDKTDFVIPIEFVQDEKGTMEHMVEHFELCADYYNFSKLED